MSRCQNGKSGGSLISKSQMASIGSSVAACRCIAVALHAIRLVENRMSIYPGLEQGSRAASPRHLILRSRCRIENFRLEVPPSVANPGRYRAAGFRASTGACHRPERAEPGVRRGSTLPMHRMKTAADRPHFASFDLRCCTAGRRGEGPNTIRPAATPVGALYSVPYEAQRIPGSCWRHNRAARRIAARVCPISAPPAKRRSHRSARAPPALAAADRAGHPDYAGTLIAGLASSARMPRRLPPLPAGFQDHGWPARRCAPRHDHQAARQEDKGGKRDSDHQSLLGPEQRMAVKLNAMPVAMLSSQTGALRPPSIRCRWSMSFRVRRRLPGALNGSLSRLHNEHACPPGHPPQE
jgi:hypothetical protein